MKSVLKRFEEKYIPEPNSGCFIWTDAVSPKGYGWFRIADKNKRAHRVSYELFNGDIGDLHVLHKCDNPFCVNPDHLFLGSNADNMEDRGKKGRTARGDRSGARKHPNSVVRGEKSASSILTEKSVLSIRKLYDSNEFSQTDLSRMFGVIQPTISQIVRRKTWAHI